MPETVFVEVVEMPDTDGHRLARFVGQPDTAEVRAEIAAEVAAMTQPKI